MFFLQPSFSPGEWDGGEGKILEEKEDLFARQFRELILNLGCGLSTLSASRLFLGEESGRRDMGMSGVVRRFGLFLFRFSGIGGKSG